MGLIAAWAADEDLLGKSSSSSKLDPEPGWRAKHTAAQHARACRTQRDAFVAQLQKLLRKLGYT